MPTGCGQRHCVALGDEPGAEASFRKALDVARRQEARSWELRAATGLARLWQRQGNVEGARDPCWPGSTAGSLRALTHRIDWRPGRLLDQLGG